MYFLLFSWLSFHADVQHQLQVRSSINNIRLEVWVSVRDNYIYFKSSQTITICLKNSSKLYRFLNLQGRFDSDTWLTIEKCINTGSVQILVFCQTGDSSGGTLSHSQINWLNTHSHLNVKNSAKRSYCRILRSCSVLQSMKRFSTCHGLGLTTFCTSHLDS